MKAVLVIDTTKCRGCPFCHESAYYAWCDAPRKERFWEMPLTSKDIEEERTVECPLRPLPSKLVPFGYLDAGNEDGLYEKGYNDCIDAITGETE